MSEKRIQTEKGIFELDKAPSGKLHECFPLKKLNREEFDELFKRARGGFYAIKPEIIEEWLKRIEFKGKEGKVLSKDSLETFIKMLFDMDRRTGPEGIKDCGVNLWNAKFETYKTSLLGSHKTDSEIANLFSDSQRFDIFLSIYMALPY